MTINADLEELKSDQKTASNFFTNKKQNHQP